MHEEESLTIFSVPNDDSDQTVQMCWLILVFLNLPDG